MLFESDISAYIYDELFKNTAHENLDFIKEYPLSYADLNNSSIYLLNNDGEQVFKIKIERV